MEKSALAGESFEDAARDLSPAATNSAIEIVSSTDLPGACNSLRAE